MSTFLLVLHVFTCLVLVLAVLVQSGKDGGIGAMGGGGSSQTIFGSSGGANFFTKFTSTAAGIFMVTSVFLTITRGGKHTSVFDHMPKTSSAPAPTTQTPAAPADAAAPPATTTAPAAPTAPQSK